MAHFASVSEVTKPEIAAILTAEQQIRWFDVSMDDLVDMGFFDAVDGFRSDEEGVGPRKFIADFLA